jgi:hypothetical protein
MVSLHSREIAVRHERIASVNRRKLALAGVGRCFLLYHANFLLFYAILHFGRADGPSTTPAKHMMLVLRSLRRQERLDLRGG